MKLINGVLQGNMIILNN